MEKSEIGKQDSFRRIFKVSASMDISSGSQFLKTTAGIQSGPNALQGSKSVMTFATNLGFTLILCSFRLVLEGNVSKEIPGHKD